MGNVTLTLEEYEALRRLITSERESEGAERSLRGPETPPKKKRKVSKYQKEFGRQMKKLKAKHPRTKVTALMSKGHAAARKALGMKQKRRSR
tara:strand:+ start:155 stop:430 length:276 start_codon:yes stop_codon:yes gene_type:complete